MASIGQCGFDCAGLGGVEVVAGYELGLRDAKQSFAGWRHEVRISPTLTLPRKGGGNQAGGNQAGGSVCNRCNGQTILLKQCQWLSRASVTTEGSP